MLKFLFIIMSLILCGCTANKVVVNPVRQELGTSTRVMPKVIIYKTVADYRNNVPVIMNDAKTAIVSYPAPCDLGNIPPLADNGFIIDTRGINANVAFLSYTYDEYKALKTIPTASELMSHIIDKNPLTVMYLTNVPYTGNINVSEINAEIASGLRNCTRVVP